MIRVEKLIKTYQAHHEQVTAVDGADFEVAPGEIMTLLGPSGCGKTTTLRCIAGLERPNGGIIAIADQSVVDCGRGLFVPAHRRRIGMVFQSYAIWPHMTVYENIAYALEGERLSRAEIRKRTLSALDLVQLADYADRPAPRLSGGQQQRVAIARAIAGHPQALLFDEPLSNLDAKLRAETRTELRRLQQHLGITSVYVTHDQSEALAISDWIIVMRNGHIIERGRPADIYARPRNLFTAHFIGNTNLIRGRVAARDGASDTVRIETPAGLLCGVDPNGILGEGEAACLSVRPEDLSVTGDGEPAANNVLVGNVVVTIFQGTTIEAELESKTGPIRCNFPRDAGIERGSRVRLAFRTTDAVVLRDEPLDGTDGR